MPRMDGTGPAGQGAGTGRGLGPCGAYGAGTQQSVGGQRRSWLDRALGVFGSMGRGAGRRGGRGMGRGGGMGRGRGRAR